MLMKMKYIKCWNAKIDENTYAWNWKINKDPEKWAEQLAKKTQKLGGSKMKSHESSKYSIEGIFTI